MTPWTMRLGWFVRRTPDPEQLADFYERVVGLPVLRRYGKATMFWLGGTTSFEVAAGGGRAPAYADRTEAACYPIVRCYDIASEIARLRAADVPFINDFKIDDENHIAYFLDHAGHVFGIQQRTRASERPEDIELLRRWESGEWRLEGAGDLPPSWQAIGWVAVRGVNPGRLIAFYREILGLPVRYQPREDLALLALDETTLLEVGAGAKSVPAPNDRTEASNAFLLRVTGLEALLADLRHKGVRFVNEPFEVDGGTIAYISDPEGHVVGVQERWESSTRIEDIAASRRSG